MGYVLGLDLGPSSIGWAAVNIDDDGNYRGLAQIPDGPKLIPAIGARIFPAGVDNLGQGQKEETRNKNRREKRGVRRTLRRRRIRRIKLVSLLREHNILPMDDSELAKLQGVNPYALRAKAIDSKIELPELGRLLLHICKHRGFKSNRKNPPKKDEKGKSKEGMTRLKEALNGKTLGQFWHEQIPELKKTGPFNAIRNRRESYQWVAERKQYNDEFNLIWDKQKQYHQQLTDKLKELTRKILFEQIPYELPPGKRAKVIGKCSLMPKELRCSLDKRKAQQFRFLQKLNDLRMVKKGEYIELTSEQRNTMRDILNSEDSVKFDKLRKATGLDDQRFNFEFEGNSAIVGNEIDTQLKGLFDKKVWASFGEQTKEMVWQTVLKYFSNEAITLEQTANEIQTICGQQVKDIENLKDISLPDGHIKFCEKVLDKILPDLWQGMQLYDAIEKAGFAKNWRKLHCLPLPDKSHGFFITNPNVSSVLFQVHRLVNRLIDEVGKPDHIVIEFARDLKANKKHRQEILRQQADRRKTKERIRQEIASLPEWPYGGNVPGWAVEKYMLWEDQGTRSPYSDKSNNGIGLSQLFSRDTEIDHILPYSLSLDDSFNNKVLCFADENQAKGQRTPWEWLSGNEETWTKVLGVIDRWKPQRKTRGSGKKTEQSDTENARKWEKFFMTADQIAEVYQPQRYLAETGFIAREVRDYLKMLYETQDSDQRVLTTKGGVTGELRKWWDLNRILGAARKIDEPEENTDVQNQPAKKNREDLRHHAIDAAVIAVTSLKLVKKVTDELQKALPRNKRKEIYVPRPWDGFEDELAKAIEQLKVSHRSQRKVKGQLHKESHYWKETNDCEQKGKYVIRKRLDGNFKQADQICDNTIKQLVKQRLYEHNNDSQKAFAEPNPVLLPNKKGMPVPVRKVRIWTDSKDSSMIKLRENIYVQRTNNNHHVEIFRITRDGKTEYICKVWNIWEVAQRVKNKQKIWLCEHPEYKDAKYVMSLSKQDAIVLDSKNGTRVAMQVTAIGQDSPSDTSIDLQMWELQVGGKNELPTKQTPNAYRIRNINDFIALNPEKVNVDLLGRLRWAEKKYWGEVLKSD